MEKSRQEDRLTTVAAIILLKPNIRNIIISRTDSIGDVVLTLPLAGILKKEFPEARIIFMGRGYTKAVIEASKFVDSFLDIEDFNKQKIQADAIVHVLPKAGIAFKALQYGIPLRIGTTNRIFHWGTCNKLLKLSRRKSSLHEAQLNIKLLEGLGVNTDYTLDEIPAYYGMERIEPLQQEYSYLIDKQKFNIILHPKSQGSAREWGLDNFIALINLLDTRKFKIFISGTPKERTLLDKIFNEVGNKVTDITNGMSLAQFMSFINSADGLVANSTGPLHIAAALGKHTLGLYPPLKPIHPGRWAPLGKHAQYFVLDKICEDCRKAPESCNCIMAIPPVDIVRALNNAWLQKFG